MVEDTPKGRRTPEEEREFMERWQKRLDSGEPTIGWVIDHLLKVAVTEEGAMLLDFPLGLSVSQTAAVARVLLLPEIVQKLKAILNANAHIPDTPISKTKPPSVN